MGKRKVKFAAASKAASHGTQEKGLSPLAGSNVSIKLLQLKAGVDQALATGPRGTQAALKRKFKFAAASKTASHWQEKGLSPLAGSVVSVKRKNTADLMPALALMESRYEEGKQRIARLNTKEI